MRRQGILYSCWRELFGSLAVFPTFSCFFFPFQLPHQTALHRTKKCYPKQIRPSSCNQSFPNPPSNLSCFPSRTLPNPRCPASSPVPAHSPHPPLPPTEANGKWRPHALLSSQGEAFLWERSYPLMRGRRTQLLCTALLLWSCSLSPF